MITPLLTFAVITDSHLKDQGDESSPYQANQLASSRNTVKQLNVLNPDFVIHLVSKEIFGALESPPHAIPGNHDIGDKPLAWMPGPKVDEQGIQAYEQYWGRSYSSFDVQDTHFVLINSPVLNSHTEYEKQLYNHLTAKGATGFATKGHPPECTSLGSQTSYTGTTEEKLKRSSLTDLCKNTIVKRQNSKK